MQTMRVVRLFLAVLAATLGGCLFAEETVALPFDKNEHWIVEDYGFDELENNGGKPLACTNMLVDALSDFFGDLLYIPARTNGVLQISNTTKRGLLAYRGKAVSPQNLLFVRACKFTGTPKKAKLAIDIVHGAATNRVSEMEFNYDEMEWRDVALSDAQSGDTLIMQPNDNIEGKRRFLIDRIIFARKKKHGFYIIIR